MALNFTTKTIKIKDKNISFRVESEFVAHLEGDQKDILIRDYRVNVIKNEDGKDTLVGVYKEMDQPYYKIINELIEIIEKNI